MVRVDLKGDHHGFDGLLGSAYANSQRLVMVYVNSSKQPPECEMEFHYYRAKIVHTLHDFGRPRLNRRTRDRWWFGLSASTGIGSHILWVTINESLCQFDYCHADLFVSARG